MSGRKNMISTSASEHTYRTMYMFMYLNILGTLHMHLCLQTCALYMYLNRLEPLPLYLCLGLQTCTLYMQWGTNISLATLAHSSTTLYYRGNDR